jgi:Tfp pilus assembly protein PilF
MPRRRLTTRNLFNIEPRSVDVYQARAKAYRATGKNDSADADEQKAKEYK